MMSGNRRYAHELGALRILIPDTLDPIEPQGGSYLYSKDGCIYARTSDGIFNLCSGGVGSVDNTPVGDEPLVVPPTTTTPTVKRLTAGANITLTSDADQVFISTAATVGEANTTSNGGTGLDITLPKVLTDLPFKGLIAGPGIILTPLPTDIEISKNGASFDVVNLEVVVLAPTFLSIGYLPWSSSYNTYSPGTVVVRAIIIDYDLEIQVIDNSATVKGSTTITTTGTHTFAITNPVADDVLTIQVRYTGAGTEFPRIKGINIDF